MNVPEYRYLLYRIVEHDIKIQKVMAGSAEPRLFSDGGAAFGSGALEGASRIATDDGG
jgi:hypothetical protein